MHNAPMVFEIDKVAISIECLSRRYTRFLAFEEDRYIPPPGYGIETMEEIQLFRICYKILHINY